MAHRGGLFLALTLACIQHPFCVAYPIAIALVEGNKCLKSHDRRLMCTLRVGVAAFCACLCYGLFLILSDRPLAASMELYSWDMVNRSVGPLYFGNWSVCLAYLGGMFPFMALAFEARVRWRFMLPVIFFALGFSYAFLPLSGYAYDDGFHLIFTSSLDRVLVQYMGLPHLLVDLAFFALVGLGTYNLAHILLFVRSAADKHFPSAGLVILVVFMGITLIDGYVSSRLYLPGMVGLFLIITAIMARKRRLLLLQLGYQFSWCILYSLALGMKHGFLGIGATIPGP